MDMPGASVLKCQCEDLGDSSVATASGNNRIHSYIVVGWVSTCYYLINKSNQDF